MSSVHGGRSGRGAKQMVAALLRQRRRLVLAAVAIALSVGYVAGALTLLNRVGQGLDDLAAAGADRADLVIEGQVAFESPVEQVRRLVPVSVGRAVEGIDGVRSVSPRVEDVAVILDPDGEPVVAPGLSEQPLGGNWPADSAVAPYRFLGAGRPPRSATEVVIDATSARRASAQVGDKVAVAGKGKVGSYTVVGLVATDRGDLPPGSSLALFETTEARRIFDRPFDDNREAVRLSQGGNRAQVEAQIRSILPPGIELVDQATAARHRQEGLTRSFTLVRVLILTFAGLALLVGTVTVGNSLTLLYADRRRTFATFRLLGATPRQMRTAALIEAALLALAASLIGAPLGLILGQVIERALGALGSSVPVAGSALSFSALLTAVILGLVATMIAAVVPAYRACQVPPIEAVIEAPTAVQISTVRRLVRIGVIAVLAGVVVGGAVLLLGQPMATALLGALGAVAVLAVVALVPFGLSFLVAGIMRRVPVRPRQLQEIGAREISQHRSRVAATAGALLLATAVVSALTVVLASFTSSISGQVDRLILADVVVDSGTFTRGGLPGDLLVKVAELPDAEAVSGWQIGRASVGANQLRLTGIDGEALSDVLSPQWVGQSVSEITDGQVAISQSFANRAGVRVGDALPVLFTSGGTESLQVEGIYEGGGILLGDAIVDRAVLSRQVPATVDIAGLVKLDPNSSTSRQSVRSLARSYGITSVLQPKEFVARRAQLLRGFERVIEWMLLFTVLEALIGVVNTLLLSIGERRRTIGLLRVAGATPAQVRRMVLVEGTSLAVMGTSCGVATGILAGWAAVASLSALGLGGLAIPFGPLAAIGTAAVVLGVLASIVPAYRASRVPPLEAVADAGGGVGRRGIGLPEPSRTTADLPVPPPLPPGLRPPPYPPSPLLPRPVVPAELAQHAPVGVAAVVVGAVGEGMTPNREAIRASMSGPDDSGALGHEEVEQLNERRADASDGVPPFLPQGAEPNVDSDNPSEPPSFLPPPVPVGASGPTGAAVVPPVPVQPLFGANASAEPAPPKVDAAAAAISAVLFGGGPAAALVPPVPAPATLEQIAAPQPSVPLFGAVESVAREVVPPAAPPVMEQQATVNSTPLFGSGVNPAAVPPVAAELPVVAPPAAVPPVAAELPVVALPAAVPPVAAELPVVAPPAAVPRSTGPRRLFENSNPIVPPAESESASSTIDSLIADSNPLPLPVTEPLSESVSVVAPVPAPAEPVPAEPVAEPVPVEPVPAEPVAEPVPVEPVSAPVAAAEPVPVEPVSAEPALTEPALTEPEPSLAVAAESAPAATSAPKLDAGAMLAAAFFGSSPSQPAPPETVADVQPAPVAAAPLAPPPAAPVEAPPATPSAPVADAQPVPVAAASLAPPSVPVADAEPVPVRPTTPQRPLFGAARAARVAAAGDQKPIAAATEPHRPASVLEPEVVPVLEPQVEDAPVPEPQIESDLTPPPPTASVPIEESPAGSSSRRGVLRRRRKETPVASTEVPDAPVESAPVAAAPAPVAPAPVVPAPVEPAAAPAPVPAPAPAAPVVSAPAAPTPVTAPVAPAPAPVAPAPEPVGQRQSVFQSQPVSASTHPAGLRFESRPQDRSGPQGGSGIGGPGDQQSPASSSAMPASLADAVRRLTTESRADAAPVLSVMASYLTDREQVLQLVQGRVRNLICVIAQTDQRLLVVADRPGRPLVESLQRSQVELRTAPSAQTSGAVDLILLDGQRRMVVSEIRDTAIAQALVSGGQAGQPNYF